MAERKKRTKASAAQTNNVSITRLEEEAGLEIYSDVNEEISNSTRQAIARYVNCIQALAYKEVGINEARIVATYEASLAYKNAGELIENEVKQAIVYEALRLRVKLSTHILFT